MARKSGKGVNKFLNFIGMVDDGDPRDTYGAGRMRMRRSAIPPARARRSRKFRSAVRAMNPRARRA